LKENTFGEGWADATGPGPPKQVGTSRMRASVWPRICRTSLVTSFVPGRFSRSTALPVTQQPTIDKVVVLAEDDRVLLTRELPDERIAGRMQANVEHVRGAVTLADTPPRQCRRKLNVDQEVQGRCRTR
jgi:hypothetical protein